MSRIEFGGGIILRTSRLESSVWASKMRRKEGWGQPNRLNGIGSYWVDASSQSLCAAWWRVGCNDALHRASRFATGGTGCQSSIRASPTTRHRKCLPNPSRLELYAVPISLHSGSTNSSGLSHSVGNVGALIPLLKCAASRPSPTRKETM